VLAQNIRELTGSGIDVWRPYLGTKPQQHLFLTSHDTPCTCCGCRSESRIGSRYRSSLPSMDASRGSGIIRICLCFGSNDTHHIQADDLSVRLLDLSQLHQKVPETRLCDDGVWCKYSHSVQLWCWVCLSWQMAANDLVFCETTY
jgi:hypothetical protein